MIDEELLSAPELSLGPDGGLTGEALAACRAAALRSAGLGPTTLGVEAAAVAAMGIAAPLGIRESTERRTS